MTGMYHSGIGGGGFMTIRKPNSETGEFSYSTIDFRETAPAGAHRDMYECNRAAAQLGGLARCMILRLWLALLRKLTCSQCCARGAEGIEIS